MIRNVIKISKFLLGWPLSVLALIFLFKLFTPQLGAIAKNISHANFFILFLALVTFQGYYFFRVLLWKAILKGKGHTVPLRYTVWYWSVAELNRYIPGNVWSIIGRGATFGKFGIKQSTLLFAWIQESILIILGSSLLGITGLGIAFNHLLPRFPLKEFVYWVVIIAVVLVGLLWIFQKRLSLYMPFSKKVKKFMTTPEDAFLQLILSFLSFSFFGLGTYLSISSIFHLSVETIGMLTGFFSLSFALGYITIITPMGLGVRELFISTGLLAFLKKDVVAVAALFARFWLVISEVIFLLGSYIFFKRPISLRSSIISHVKKYKYEYCLGISIAIYIIYFTAASFLRYTNFFTGRFDLGNMDQTVWNTLHGKIFQLTDPNGTNIMSRLGTHADFILVLLAPFYILWEDPRMLLLIQTLVLALGALFVFLIAKDVIKHKSFAYIISLSYLLNPSVQYTNLFDFHPVTLATTFFLGAWYFLKKKNYVLTIIFLVLAGLTKEEAWIVVGLFGLYFVFFEKKRLLGICMTLLSAALFYLLIWKFIPLARGGQHFALSYYADFGSTPTSVIKNILFSPEKTLPILFSPRRITYILELFFPLGFLSLFTPLLLIFALPELAINILSNNTQMQQISYQYTAVITPFLFIAAIYAIIFLRKRFTKIPLLFFSSIVLISTLISAYIYGPLPGADHPNIDMFIKQESDSVVLESFIQDIPSTFSVAATNNVGSHLSHRQKIYTIPVGIDKADIVVFLLNDQFAQPSLAFQKDTAEKMKHDKNYIEVFKENDFIVFEKRNLYTKSEPIIEKKKLYPTAIEALQHRDFEGGQVHIQKTVRTNMGFTTVLFSYPSDGLTVYARADIPQTTNTHTTLPVVIINRGFLTTSAFNEETSYQNISETFAKNGFIAITPNYRNNGESDKDTSIVAAAPIDVLNLLSSLASFPQADTKHIFLWGYSVGGQITLSTLAAYDQNTNFSIHVKAASVWAPIIDQSMAYQRFRNLFPGQQIPYMTLAQKFGPFDRNQIPWESVSPLYYLDDISTPTRVVQSITDTVAPYQWAIELFDVLKSHQSNAQLQLYQDVDHNFTGVWRSAVAGDIQFFRSYL